MKARKIVALLAVAAMTAGVFAGCGSTGSSDGGADASSTEGASTGGSGSVYYLNYKPEVDSQWQDLAAKYTEETGVPVTVVTAASGTYEQTLTSEIAKTEAPTLFQVENQSWLDNWGQYCYDLAGSYIAEHSTANVLSMEDVEVAAIPFATESYGIIYNVDLLEKYCGLDNAVVSSIDEINNFDKLKAVADDIQARADELGVEAAFSCAGLDSSSDWRYTTHLADVPIYWEFIEKGITSSTTLDGTYLDNYKNLIDLYFTDSTCDPALLSGKTSDDSIAEFCDELTVFYQGGTWDWTSDNEFSEMNIAFLPLYTGVEGEENIGVCTGTGNYWCINKNSTEEDIQATLDFLEWVISSDEGKNTLALNMAFNCPFDTFEDVELENPLFTSANEYVAAGKTEISWIGTESIPTENWKSSLSSALIEYSQGTADWSNVERVFTEEWASEWESR